jgi:hypothetical protein
MNVEWEKQFIQGHPLKIKDTDLFLHGTSSKNYSAIQHIGFLLRDSVARNWSISQSGICFERYRKEAGISIDNFIDLMKHYCEVACKRDGSTEGVVLQLTGRELKEIGCCTEPDLNKPLELKYDSEGIPIDINSDASFLSIVVKDCDIPIKYLRVVRRISFKS